MKTENIFRFISVRPPQPRDSENPLVINENKEDKEIIERINNKMNEEKLKADEARREVGIEVLDSNEYFIRYANWQVLRKVRTKLLNLVETVRGEENPITDQFEKDVEKVLSNVYDISTTFKGWINSDTFLDLKMSLWKSYYGNVLTPSSRPADREELIAWIRLFYLFEAAVEGPVNFTEVLAVFRVLRPSIPADFFITNVQLESPPPPKQEPAEDLVANQKKVLENLKVAQRQLKDIYYSKLVALPAEKEVVNDHPSEEPDFDSAVPRIITGRINLLKNAPWRLNKDDLKEKKELSHVMQEIGIIPEVIRIPDLLQQIETEIAKEVSVLSDLSVQKKIVSVGSTFAHANVTTIDRLPNIPELIIPPLALPKFKPKPSIKPIGVGDLKIVKQQLIGYKDGEIAHIENVLAKENRERQHRRLRQIEEIVTEELDREEESIRDLQSTERFELESETKKTILSETTFEAGAELSAEYGPVSLAAFAKFASQGSKEESDKNSSKYSKELIDRSLVRLKTRVRQERSTRTLEEFEEINKHGFDNTGETHITGIYRWLDKYYRAKVFNYGKRLMYEFIVPEPAVFYLFSKQQNYNNKVLPVKPEPPVVPLTNSPLTPSLIDRENYMELVKMYRAEGVEPPPATEVVVTKSISREFQSGLGSWSFSNEVMDIPKGYKPVSGGYGFDFHVADNSRSLRILIGQNRVHYFEHITNNVADYVLVNILPTTLEFDGEMNQIPISGIGVNISNFVMNIEVCCQLTQESEQRWKLNTYKAIMNAYNKDLLDYEEQVAAAQIQLGGKIGGNNPLINREIEKEELKRSCLELWNVGILNNPPAIYYGGSENYPRIFQKNAIENAEKIEFFEKAFEWRNLTYEFLSYFWAREKTWIDLNALESTDPMFERFLKAGAARVVVPVTPSFTEAVLYYQLTGEIWSGGPVPSLSSTNDPDAVLYESYLQEMQHVADEIDMNQDENISADDPDTWPIKVPTDLIRLQSNGDLPDIVIS